MRVLALLCWLLPAVCLAKNQAVLTAEHVLASDAGVVRAWRRSDLALAPGRHLASDGSALWAVAGTSLLQGQPGEGSWKVARTIAPDVQALAVHRGQPVLVYDLAVVLPLSDQRHPLPAPTKAPKINGLGLQDVLLQDGRLWLATRAPREFGGRVLVLDLGRGTWAEHADHTRPTALASGPEGTVWVASATGRLDVEAQLKQLRPDAQVALQQHLWDGMVALRLAAGPKAGTLFAVASVGSLQHAPSPEYPKGSVEIRPLRLVRLGWQDPIALLGEPRRVAKSPSLGCDQLLVLDADTFLVVPLEGPPLVVRQGKVERLPTQ